MRVPLLRATWLLPPTCGDAGGGGSKVGDDRVVLRPPTLRLLLGSRACLHCRLELGSRLHAVGAAAAPCSTAASAAPCCGQQQTRDANETPSLQRGNAPLLR